MKNTFAEYVAKRDRINEDLSWLPSVPLIGWAAGAAASAAFLAFRRWAERNAKSRREYQDMADWWRILDKLIEMGDSRAIKDHMKLTEKHPYDAIKRMAEIHLADAKKETAAGVRESYDELPVEDEYSARLAHDDLEDRGVDDEKRAINLLKRLSGYVNNTYTKLETLCGEMYEMSDMDPEEVYGMNRDAAPEYERKTEDVYRKMNGILYRLHQINMQCQSEEISLKHNIGHFWEWFQEISLKILPGLIKCELPNVLTFNNNKIETLRKQFVEITNSFIHVVKNSKIDVLIQSHRHREFEKRFPRKVR